MPNNAEDAARIRAEQEDAQRFRRLKTRYKFAQTNDDAHDLAVEQLQLERRLAKQERELALYREQGPTALLDAHARRLGYADALEALTELGRAQVALRVPRPARDTDGEDALLAAAAAHEVRLGLGGPGRSNATAPSHLADLQKDGPAAPGEPSGEAA